MRKSIVVAALAIGVGVTIGSVHAQAPERGGQVLPPSVSKRGDRQIGSSALNLLGLRVGFSAGAFGPISFSEAAAKADALGTGFLEASSSQKVSPEIPKSLNYDLSAEEVTAVKNRLAELRLRLVAYRAGAIPADESSRRRLFAFAKAVDIETIVTSAEPAALADLDKLAGEYGVNVAVRRCEFEKSRELARWPKQPDRTERGHRCLGTGRYQAHRRAKTGQRSAAHLGLA